MFTKPEWMPEWAFRAIRTFVQAFIGVFGATLVAVLTSFAEARVFDWQLLLYGGVVAGLAAGVAALMNRGPEA